MDKNYIYDHSAMSIILLKRSGIQSTVELEDVIEGESYWETIGNGIRIATGFTIKMHALKVAFRMDGEVVFSLQADRATIEEIKRDFCSNCK